MVFGWLALLGLIAYRVHRRAGSIPGHEAPGRSGAAGASPVYLPDIGYFDGDVYFDPELGYTDVIVPESVPSEWINAYGAETDGWPTTGDTEPPRSRQPE